MPAEQRSIGLSETTLALLGQTAMQTGESRNALADRLLGEALRLERHPLIRFQQVDADLEAAQRVEEEERARSERRRRALA